MNSVSSPRSFSGARAFGAALLFFGVLSLVGCESARQPVPRSPIVRSQVRAKGRAIIERACEMHGGLARWTATNDASFRLVDQWIGPSARVVRPWPVATANGQFQILLHQGYGRVQIHAEKGTTITYGIGPGGPWALRGMRPSEDSGDLATARATIPVYQFFFQLPFSFLADDAVQHYMGVKPAPPGGAVYEVLVTYPWYTGDRSRDWYVARFDTSSMRLRSVTYTTSLWGPSVFEYTDDLDGYTQIDSLWVPTRHNVRMTWPFRPELHRWTVSDIRFNQGIDETAFRGPARLGGS